MRFLGGGVGGNCGQEPPDCPLKKCDVTRRTSAADVERADEADQRGTIKNNVIAPTA